MLHPTLLICHVMFSVCNKLPLENIGISKRKNIVLLAKIQFLLKAVLLKLLPLCNMSENVCVYVCMHTCVLQEYRH